MKFYIDLVKIKRKQTFFLAVLGFGLRASHLLGLPLEPHLKPKKEKQKR
jgi:hypothetical protein